MAPFLEDLIDLHELETFGRGTIVPILGAVATLAVSVEAMADAEVATAAGANGIRYYGGNLEYSTTAYNPVTPAGSENPSEEGWYEYTNNRYTPTADTSVVAGKTYYSITITWHTITTGGGGSSELEARVEDCEQNILALALAFAIEQGAAVDGTSDNIVVETFADTSGYILISGMYDSTNHWVWA